MDLSVLIPVYNTAKWLPDCLDSILSQDYSSFQIEIIIVNDGSSDESLTIINRYIDNHPNIILINQENKGLSFSRNIALKKAKGRYVLFVDSDDYLYPDSLLPLLYKADTLNSDMLSFAAYSVYPNLREERFNRDVLHEFENISGITYLKYINLIGGVCRFLFRRDFLLDNNLFMHDGIYCEDELFLPIAISISKRVTTTDIKVYGYRRRDGSITTSKNDAHKLKILNDRLFVLEELLRYSKASCAEIQKALEHKISLLTLDIILNLYKDDYTLFQRKDTLSKLYLKGFLPLRNSNRSIKYKIVSLLVNNSLLFQFFKRLIPFLNL